jgi:hypothetical protein
MEYYVTSSDFGKLRKGFPARDDRGAVARVEGRTAQKRDFGRMANPHRMDGENTEICYGFDRAVGS